MVRQHQSGLTKTQYRKNAMQEVMRFGVTGTRSNNVAESAGINAIFGEHFLATSYKQRIGHTMGASGLVELILALRDAREGVARGIPNRTGGDERFLCEDRQVPIGRILALASGMGNVFGAAICDLA